MRQSVGARRKLGQSEHCNNVTKIFLAVLVSICFLVGMNADRRKAIEKIESRLRSLRGTANDLKSEIDGIKDDESESKEALPESMQNGDKAEAMDTAISNLDTAIEEADDILLSVDECIRNLEAAREG